MFQSSSMKQRLIESYKKQMDDITCILDCGNFGSLYLGNIESACDFELLQKLKIKSIISICTSKIPIQISQSMKYYQQIILDDSENANISRHFEICFEFIERGRSVGNVLVHCMAGISRSATIVAAYLMKKHCISSKEALQQLQRKRWQVYPNEGFIKQLLLKQYFFQLYYNIMKNQQLNKRNSKMIEWKRIKNRQIFNKQEILQILIFLIKKIVIRINSNLMNIKKQDKNILIQKTSNSKRSRWTIKHYKREELVIIKKIIMKLKINLIDFNKQHQKFKELKVNINRQDLLIRVLLQMNKGNYVSIQKHQSRQGLSIETNLNGSQKYFEHRIYPSTTRNVKVQYQYKQN